MQLLVHQCRLRRLGSFAKSVEFTTAQPTVSSTKHDSSTPVFPMHNFISVRTSLSELDVRMHILHSCCKRTTTMFVTTIGDAITVALDSVYSHVRSARRLHIGRTMLSCMYLGSSASADAALISLSWPASAENSLGYATICKAMTIARGSDLQLCKRRLLCSLPGDYHRVLATGDWVRILRV